MSPFDSDIAKLYEQEIKHTKKFNWKKEVKKSASQEAAKAAGLSVLAPFLLTTVTGVFTAVLIINFATEKVVDQLAHETKINVGQKKIIKTVAKIVLLAALLITTASFGLAPPIALIIGSLFAIKLIYDLALHDIPIAKHERKLQKLMAK